MTKKIIHITPAHDWFFVFKDVTTNQPVAMTIAVWALYDDGTVGALVGNVDAPKLVTPPPVRGRFVHTTELREQDVKSSSRVL